MTSYLLLIRSGELSRWLHPLTSLFPFFLNPLFIYFNLPLRFRLKFNETVRRKPFWSFIHWHHFIESNSYQLLYSNIRIDVTVSRAAIISGQSEGLLFIVMMASPDTPFSSLWYIWNLWRFSFGKTERYLCLHLNLIIKCSDALDMKDKSRMRITTAILNSPFFEVEVNWSKQQQQCKIK